jgi:predicted transport protein
MGDIKLFRMNGSAVAELEAYSVTVEKSLQVLIERHLDVFLGVRFLETEYSTGKKHGGRIDTLGIDENGCPVIIEYKRATNENVINQGLFYLDWLMDHKAEFKLLVMDKLDKTAADEIEWSTPRLICIASDFTKYDEHAVQQINRNIELVRYRKYGTDLVLLELVNAVSATIVEPGSESGGGNGAGTGSYYYKTIQETLDQISGPLKDRFEAVKAYLLAMGDDVQMKVLKFYVAFKRIKNFACVEVRTQEGKILVYTKIDPASLQLEDGFTRNVTDIGHFGTGNLEITIKSDADFEKAKSLLDQSYEAN